jgi:hypothetical protein
VDVFSSLGHEGCLSMNKLSKIAWLSKHSCYNNVITVFSMPQNGEAEP